LQSRATSFGEDAADRLLAQADELGRELHRFTDAVESGHKPARK